jgi:L-lactate dehydrogenase complex protein LldG
VGTARDRVLGKIRAALGRSAPLPPERIDVMRAYIAEHPVGPRPRADWDPVARLTERAATLSTTVDTVETLASVPLAVKRYLDANQLPNQAVVWPDVSALDWSGAGVAVEARKVQGSDLIGITGTYCAVAETGTLLLLSGAPTPASTSLVPETHIAIVPVGRIVKSMEDAWALLRTERGRLPRSTNFVSGPSRTADIEQTLVLGAHGPYRVHMILVQEEPGA